MNAFSASYSDFKLVKTRGCVQIIFEVPVEQSTAVLKILGGMPTPAEEKWFGIAPLDPKLMRESEVTLNPRNQPTVSEQHKTAPAIALVPHTERSRAHPKQAWNDIAPSQQAGIVCNDTQFWKFLQAHGVDVHDADSAANYVRTLCRVTSRSAFNSDEAAAGRWRSLVGNYRNWQRAPEYVA